MSFSGTPSRIAVSQRARTVSDHRLWLPLRRNADGTKPGRVLPAHLAQQRQQPLERNGHAVEVALLMLPKFANTARGRSQKLTYPPLKLML